MCCRSANLFMKKLTRARVVPISAGLLGVLVGFRANSLGRFALRALRGPSEESATCGGRSSLLERRIIGNGAISNGHRPVSGRAGQLIGGVQMISGRRFALVCLSSAVLLVASSSSRAEVAGTCSCKSDTCGGRWELRAANLKALRAQCRAKTDDRGLLSRVHRPKR
jgi:hypothetical protein